MTHRECQNCRHWAKDSVLTLGQCRINPPSCKDKWPFTAPDDWCSRGYSPTEALENERKTMLADLVAGEG